MGKIIRILSIAETTVCRWKKQYGGLEPEQVREPIQLRAEYAKLRKLVAELVLDEAMSQDIAQTNACSIATTLGSTVPQITLTQ